MTPWFVCSSRPAALEHSKLLHSTDLYFFSRKCTHLPSKDRVWADLEPTTTATTSTNDTKRCITCHVSNPHLLTISHDWSARLGQLAQLTRGKSKSKSKSKSKAGAGAGAGGKSDCLDALRQPSPLPLLCSQTSVRLHTPHSCPHVGADSQTAWWARAPFRQRAVPQQCPQQCP